MRVYSKAKTLLTIIALSLYLILPISVYANDNSANDSFFASVLNSLTCSLRSVINLPCEERVEEKVNPTETTPATNDVSVHNPLTSTPIASKDSQTSVNTIIRNSHSSSAKEPETDLSGYLTKEEFSAFTDFLALQSSQTEYDFDKAFNMASHDIDVGFNNVSSALVALENGLTDVSQYLTQWTTSDSDIYYEGGKVGIATTSPWRTLSVTGTVSFDGLTTAPSSANAICLSAGKELLVNTGAQTCTVSSLRFKHNIESLSVSLDKIKALRPVSFIYNGGEEERVGFIAEEVIKIDPRLVFTEEDGVTPRGVRYEDITSLLVKAIQEQQKQIDELKALVENAKTEGGKDYTDKIETVETASEATTTDTTN